MASQAFTSAGTKIYLSAGLPATYDAAGFTALTFTEIGEVTNIGSYGKKYNVVKHNPLATRATVKRKGSYDNGTLQLKIAKSKVSDAGQTLLSTASSDDNSYAFKIVLQNGKIDYFTGQTTSYMIEVGSVDQITGISADVELDADIIEV